MTDNDLEIVLPESDDVLTCSKCKTANPLESNFCLNCGTRLLVSPGRKSKWPWIVFLIICGAGLLVYFQRQTTQPELPKKAPVEISPAKTPTPPVAETKSPPQEVSPIKDEAISLSTPLQTKIPVGIVVIKDITGQTLNEIPVPVIGGGWVALPTRACLGGLGMDPENGL